jgi:hypothetical protein
VNVAPSLKSASGERGDLRRVADDLWVVEVPLRFMGVPVGRRMTVVRLGDGGLWLHSPAPLTDELRASLEAIGHPRFVVAPTAVHGHRFMEQYRDAYPDLELHAAPVLDRRRRDLAFDGILGTTTDPRWSEDIDQAVFQGHLAPEVVFLHRPSRSLILADLLMAPSVTGAMPAGARLVWRLEGLGRRPATPRSVRVSTLNRRAARRSVEQILEWDFDRIILGHGPNVETRGRDVFREAMKWLWRGEVPANSVDAT